MAKKVFVSGCYDMLHSGHVAFFQEAASYGDLYVGLGSDQTIFELKNRKTVNSNEERLFMVKALRCVKDAWINKGHGLMDFVEEVLELKPDIFFVNTDGYTPAKEAFCKEQNIELIVSRRQPHTGLPVRSTTEIRKDCRIPYRIEMCGGWLDQPFINRLYPGSVITLQIEPSCEFNDRSGMATSSRKKAIELWQAQIPVGDREALAKILFCVENPPGTENISGAQDQLGILLPGLNKLNFDNGYWPESVNSALEDDLLLFIQTHMSLLPLTPRYSGYNVFQDKQISLDSIKELAESSEICWEALMSRDVVKWGKAIRKCFEAQIAMFPHMITEELQKTVQRHKDKLLGYKLTGAGGGGYLIMISETPIENALTIIPSKI